MVLNHDDISLTSECIRLRIIFVKGICMIRIRIGFIRLLCVRIVHLFSSIMKSRKDFNCLIGFSRVEICVDDVLYEGFSITYLNASCHFDLLLYSFI